jgi:hydrogenase expression/formation protein HypD
VKYCDEYRNKALILQVAGELRKISKKEMVIMEVCGGHTMAIHRFGLHSLLPANVRLVSGPGCPVCVSGRDFLDKAIAYSRLPDTILATYGDLIRVPGSFTSLEKEKAEGRDIRIVYSSLDALAIAKAYPGKRVIFLGIGFETTAPATAAAILQAEKDHTSNFMVLSAHKIMPPAMEALVTEGVKINGFIAPGHVSAITGTSMYNFLAEKHALGVVVAGFEPADLMLSILILVRQFESGKPEVEIQYRRVVRKEGNPMASKLMEQVFELKEDHWRGLGNISQSGLKIRPEFSSWNAEIQIPMEIPHTGEPEGCICGQILRGVQIPPECRLFARSCTTDNPVGACMVSSEGTCATYYKYRT